MSLPYAGRTVLVTGAGGFVGAHLVRALAQAGAAVHGLGLGGPGNAQALASWTELDLAAAPGLAEIVGTFAPDAIVHLAGQSSAAVSFADPEGTFRVNAGGTWKLLDAVAAAAPRARVLVVGTSEVYGPCRSGERVHEDAPFAPVSPYGLSKATADLVAAAYAVARKLDVVRARPFGHIGPGQTTRFVIPAWARQVARIEAGAAEPVMRVGNLEVTRDLTDVRDIVVGYMALLERGTTGRAYNLCRGEGVSLADVARDLVAKARVAVRIEVDPALLRPADLPYLVGDPSRAAGECGWRATTSLERSLGDVLEEWRGRGGADSPAGA